MFSLNIKGAKSLSKKLKKMEQFNPVEMYRLVKKESTPIVNTAIGLVPVNSGKLKRSIGFVERGKKSNYPVVIIGPRSYGSYAGFHAHIVEFGTAGRHWQNGKSTGIMPAHPFMRPAFDVNKALVTQNIKRSFKKMINEKAKKLKLK